MYVCNRYSKVITYYFVYRTLFLKVAKKSIKKLLFLTYVIQGDFFWCLPIEGRGRIIIVAFIVC